MSGVEKMINEIKPTDENSAIFQIAIQKRIEAQRREIYPTAEDIIVELNVGEES